MGIFKDQDPMKLEFSQSMDSFAASPVALG